MTKRELQTARYESEAELTRERIASTVDDLHERLNPRALLADVADALHDTTDAVIDTGSQLVREHPAFLAGVGIAAGTLFIARGKLANRSSYDPYASYGLEDASDYSGNGSSGSGSTLKRGLRRLRGGASNAREQFIDTAHSAGDIASDRWHSTRNRAEDYADRVRAHSWQTGGTVENHPLATLLIGVAVGALLGAILPRTRLEDDYLGDTSDRLLDAARQAARTAAEVGKQDLQQRGLNGAGAKTLVSDLSEQAKGGLSGIADAAKERLTQVAEDAKEVAKHAGAAAAEDFKAKAQMGSSAAGTSPLPTTTPGF
jgi:ElaB/YqjD/DUF883 family membrane-anchored ribosome-binding protein